MIILCSTIIVLFWIVLIIEVAIMLIIIKYSITSDYKSKKQNKIETIEFIAGTK